MDTCSHIDIEGGCSHQITFETQNNNKNNNNNNNNNRRVINDNINNFALLEIVENIMCKKNNNVIPFVMFDNTDIIIHCCVQGLYQNTNNYQRIGLGYDNNNTTVQTQRNQMYVIRFTQNQNIVFLFFSDCAKSQLKRGNTYKIQRITILCYKQK